MATFLDWVGVAGFLLALGQATIPVISNWWRQRGSSVLAYPVGKVEFGFGPVGNTVALEGNFRAVKEDFFVYGLSVLVRREIDGAVLNLDWAGVRARKVVASLQPLPSAILSPTGFELRQQTAQYYHIVFAELGTTLTSAQIFGDLQNEVVDRMKAASFIPHPDEESQQRALQFRRGLLNQLFETGRFEQIRARLESTCFWRPGDYTLELTTKTASPIRQFRQSWRFTVTSEQSAASKNNAERMLFCHLGEQCLLNFPEAPYLESPQGSGL